MALRDSVTDRAHSRVGTVLKGKWCLDRVLGAGGMATVFAATHRNQNRVAIKMLHPEVSLDADVTARFLREGYVANSVNHPGTVKILDDDVSEDGAPFLVMELLEGETLEARWLRKDESLPVSEVLPIADQLLDVLAVAHDAGIVHRDIKPENLFLTTDGRLKVLDFGIARLREMSGNSAATTRAGSLLGTPAFMAPEQARGRWDDVDHRTDIWGVGATLFTLLTGGFVHDAETVNEQLILSATTPAPSVARIMPGLPDAVVALVDRALAFDKDARFDDAHAMQDAVRAAMNAMSFDAPLRVPRASVVINAATDTLIAPPEVTSAITSRGRADTLSTDRVMLRSASGGRVPVRRGMASWAIAAGVGALALVAVVLLLLRGGDDATVGTGAAAPDTAELHTAATVKPARVDDVAPVDSAPSVRDVPAPPASAPPAGTAASPAKPPATHAVVAQHVSPPVRGVPTPAHSATAAPHTTPATKPPPTAPNPFDRRH